MSKVRNSDIRSELRPSAQLLKLTYTAATEAAFEKFDRQCIKKNRGKWKSRNTVAEEKAIVRSDGSILRILVVRCEDAEEENATGLLWLHDGGYAYGVPEQEVLNNLGNNLTYDVIQPRYAREMIDWFKNKKLDRDYVFKIAWFLPGIHNFNVVARRANMPNDLDVRRANTCDVADFINVGLRPDYILRPITGDYDTRLNQFIWLLADKTTQSGR